MAPTYVMERPDDLGLLVVIGGPGGTGSSTIAKILARKWGLHHVDAGEIMRNKNSYKKLSSFLTSRVSSHPEIDKSIDRFLVRMSYSPNILIESKFFASIATVMGIPCSIKIWINSDIQTRIYRILEREGLLEDIKLVTPQDKLYTETHVELMHRQSNDQKRARYLYHVDLSKPELYNDIVIDTTGLNIPFTITKLFNAIKENDNLKKQFSPRQLKY